MTSVSSEPYALATRRDRAMLLARAYGSTDKDQGASSSEPPPTPKSGAGVPQQPLSPTLGGGSPAPPVHATTDAMSSSGYGYDMSSAYSVYSGAGRAAARPPRGSRSPCRGSPRSPRRAPRPGGGTGSRDLRGRRPPVPPQEALAAAVMAAGRAHASPQGKRLN